jgi:hypothetical protein
VGALDEPIVVAVILVTVFVVAEIWARARPPRREFDDADGDDRRRRPDADPW